LNTIDDVLSGRAKWCVVTGDCLDVLRTIPAGSVDAVVTDPPYGINYEASRYPHSSFKGVIVGDDAPFDPSPILALGLPSIMWGANNYAESLPRGGWLCWDKREHEAADKILGSPFELAWCSVPTKFAMVRCLHCGAVNADGAGPRHHPTMKPQRVMKWCLSVLAIDENAIVLDPYAGSGSTGVACVQTGRRFIGIEIDEGYATIARRRIAEAANHLFAGSNA
jgi:site-specific DNA-methyltransferase (adenine-specific)